MLAPGAAPGSRLNREKLYSYSEKRQPFYSTGRVVFSGQATPFSTRINFLVLATE
jgi:hypothetical protein